MEPGLAILAGIILIGVGIVFQAFVLRVSARWVAGEQVDLGTAAITVVVGGIVNALVTAALGLVMPAGGALLSGLIGVAVYGAVIAMFTGIDWGRSILVGVVMSVLTFVIGFVLVVGLMGVMLAGNG